MKNETRTASTDNIVENASPGMTSALVEHDRVQREITADKERMWKEAMEGVVAVLKEHQVFDDITYRIENGSVVVTIPEIHEDTTLFRFESNRQIDELMLPHLRKINSSVLPITSECPKISPGVELVVINIKDFIL